MEKMECEDGNWQSWDFVLKINVLDNFDALLHKIIKDCWDNLLIFEDISLTILNEDKLTVKTCDGSDYNYLSLLQMLWLYCDCVGCERKY